MGHFLAFIPWIFLTYWDVLLQKCPPLDPVKSTLETLSLQNNLLTAIALDYFSGFARLHFVNLARNRLNALPNFKPLTQTLRQLMAAFNNIISLRPLTNAAFSKLHFLDVKHNKIGQLHRAMFSHWPRLGRLRIDFNLVTTLENMSVLNHGRAIQVSCKSIIE